MGRPLTFGLFWDSLAGARWPTRCAPRLLIDVWRPTDGIKSSRRAPGHINVAHAQCECSALSHHRQSASTRRSNEERDFRFGAQSGHSGVLIEFILTKVAAASPCELKIVSSCFLDAPKRWDERLHC
jgi:hypothetical protein